LEGKSGGIKKREKREREKKNTEKKRGEKKIRDPTAALPQLRRIEKNDARRIPRRIRRALRGGSNVD